MIARIDPSTYQAQIAQGSAAVASARANLASAQATLRNAEADYTRKAALAQQQLVARSDADLARAARDQARAQVNAAQAQITQQQASTQTSRLNLQRTVIRSPVDGVVLTRTVEPGQTVAASLQAPVLFQIAEDLSKMEIVLAIDEADIGQVKAGPGRELHRRCVPRAPVPRHGAAGAPVGDQHQQRDHLSGGGRGRQPRPEPAAGHDRQCRDRSQPPRRRAAGAERGAALQARRRRTAPATQPRPRRGARRRHGRRPAAASRRRCSSTRRSRPRSTPRWQQMRERSGRARSAPAAAQQRAAAAPVRRRPRRSAAAATAAAAAATSGAMRQRMQERFNQQFAAFRATLDAAQQRQLGQRRRGAWSARAARRCTSWSTASRSRSSVRVGAQRRQQHRSLRRHRAKATW